jgi:hypothetical protein
MRRLLPLLILLAMPASARADQPEQIAAKLAAKMGTVTMVSVTKDATFTTATYEGSFTDEEAHRPCGFSAPTGKKLTLKVNNATGFVKEVSLADPGPETREECQSTGGELVNPNPKEEPGPTARVATWGSHGCSRGKRCYLQARWAMSGAEHVQGQVCWQDTEAMFVYIGGYGEFVSHECWTAFEGPGKNWWVEEGQEAGCVNEGTTLHCGCCELHPFAARFNSTYGYWGNAMEWTVAGYQQNEYVMESLRDGKGTWRGYWCIPGHPSCETEIEVPHMETFSNELAVGSEMQTEVDPNALGNDTDWYEAVGGGWHQWKKQTTWVQEDGCIYLPSGVPGDARYFTHANFAECPE